MNKLKIKFAGIELNSPIIAGSCGLTSDINNLKEMENNGVGAIILKSIFEEQINMEIAKQLESSTNSYPEEVDYIQNYLRANTIQQYIDLIKSAKAAVKTPIIASVSCLNDGEWVDFSKQLEQAGADALELNIFMLPTDEFLESAEIEQRYFNIVKHLKSVIKIPLIVKISRYFTNIPAFVNKLSAYGVDAVTIFNRFYEPDIDIDKMNIKAAPMFSSATDLKTTLRWTGILSAKYNNLEISASSGVLNGESVVKLLLAGATTVQVCSALYQDGLGSIKTMNNFISEWMDLKGFKSIEEFAGKLSYKDTTQANLYERAQFMKYFSDNK